MSSDMEEDGLEMGGGGRKKTGDRDILAQAQVSRSLSFKWGYTWFCDRLAAVQDQGRGSRVARGGAGFAAPSSPCKGGPWHVWELA